MQPQSKQDASCDGGGAWLGEVVLCPSPTPARPGGLSVRSGSLTQQISCWLELDTPLFLFHFIYKVTCKSPRIKFQGFFFSGWDETWGWGQVCVCVSLTTYCQRNVKWKTELIFQRNFEEDGKKALSKIHVPNSWLQGCRVQILGTHRNQGNQI